MEDLSAEQNQGHHTKQVIKPTIVVKTYYRIFKGNCFRVFQSVEVENPVRFNKVRSNTMVPAECNKICKDKSYSYFGLRHGNLCMCGNKPLSPARKWKMKRCNKMCTGNSSLRCGGGKALNLFKVCTEANCNFSYE